jgi:hypothetical protein
MPQTEGFKESFKKEAVNLRSVLNISFMTDAKNYLMGRCYEH